MRKIFIFLIAFIISIIPLNNTSIFVEAASITLNQTKMTLGINKTQKLQVTLSSDLSSSNITYSSSNTSVATVDTNGIVTGISSGTAYITVSVSGIKEICAVTVIKDYIAVTGITLNKTSIDLTINETMTLVASLSPANASNKTITFSSNNPKVATVNSSGLITGKSAGVAYITVESGNNKAICQVNVTDKISLKSISTKTSLTIKEKETSTLTVTYSPSNATNKSVTWKSSNTNVVTVSDKGVVTGISPGSATITIISKDGGHVATCKVTVQEISKEVKSISLNKKELTIEAGKEETLTVNFEPTYAENKKVTWKSSDTKIATVKDGKISALTAGTVTITAVSEDGKKEATCKVTVTAKPIESIAFEKEEQTIYLGEKTALKTIATPTGSTIENPIWKSSDESIATIKDGVLTPLSIGTVTITISNQDNTITASTIVNIAEKPAEPLSITVDGYNLNFDPNKKDYTLTIGSESTLTINTNVDANKVIINGNKDLKNGSIITITIKGDTPSTYIINIKKKETYTMYFIVAISVLLFLNIIRVLIKNKKKKDE